MEARKKEQDLFATARNSQNKKDILEQGSALHVLSRWLRQVQLQRLEHSEADLKMAQKQLEEQKVSLQRLESDKELQSLGRRLQNLDVNSVSNLFFGGEKNMVGDWQVFFGRTAYYL